MKRFRRSGLRNSPNIAADWSCQEQERGTRHSSAAGDGGQKDVEEEGPVRPKNGSKHLETRSYPPLLQAIKDAGERPRAVDETCTVLCPTLVSAL